MSAVLENVSVTGWFFVGLLDINGEEITEYVGERKPVYVGGDVTVEVDFEFKTPLVLTDFFLSKKEKKGVPAGDLESWARQSADSIGGRHIMTGDRAYLTWEDGFKLLLPEVVAKHLKLNYKEI